MPQSLSPVTSAVIENVQVDTAREAVRFDIRNLSPQRITAFHAVLSEVGPNEPPKFCNGGGQDMLDWSDPMPGTNLYVHMHRTWIEPGTTLRSERYWLDCRTLRNAPQHAHVELKLITFEDGTGEGDPNLLYFFFRTRKLVLEERLKWLPRFLALRNSSNLTDDAGPLYRDLTKAKYDAESDLERSRSDGLTRATLEQLQETVRQIVTYSNGHTRLQPGTPAAWLITDLEQRTERLMHGIGTDPGPAPQ
ncbi:MAG TPA: hypothetical protein VKX25_13425 [Bryobacteraceae bacterium]|jgi:hypothetical protein|nr:hypothetical protein [Bryobacteraceae bacterium]